jgi:hypothetical protein
MEFPENHCFYLMLIKVINNHLNLHRIYFNVTLAFLEILVKINYFLFKKKKL